MLWLIGVVMATGVDTYICRVVGIILRGRITNSYYYNYDDVLGVGGIVGHTT